MSQQSISSCFTKAYLHFTPLTFSLAFPYFSPATIQKRLKKEKKVKRKLQEALDFESKRRQQVEQALKQGTSPESLCMSLNGVHFFPLHSFL